MIDIGDVLGDTTNRALAVAVSQHPVETGLSSEYGGQDMMGISRFVMLLGLP